MVDGHQDESDEQNAREGPESDLLQAVKGIDDAAKSKSHGNAGRTTHEDDNGGPVLGEELLSECQIRGRVDVGQTQDQGRGEDGGDEQVDVKGPTPGGAALGKSAADDRTEDAAQAPGDDDAGEVERPFVLGRGHGDVGDGARVAAAGADALDDSADNEGVHIGGGAAENATDFEGNDERKEQPLYVEDAICSSAVFGQGGGGSLFG